MKMPAQPADSQRFTQVVSPYMLSLLRVAATFVGIEHAEDVVQETLTHAWLAFATLQDESHAFSWLTRITINLCKDWLRGHFGTVRRTSIALSEEFLPPLEETIGTTDHAAIIDLRQAVNALDEETRLIVVLRFYIGMNATEIATTMGIPASTIRTRLSRTLHALQTQLALPPHTAEQEVTHE